MHVKVKINDLSLAQWEYLRREVPVGGRDFLPGLPRVCAVFELTAEVTGLQVGMDELHVEMDVIELSSVLIRLKGLDIRDQAEAALAETPGLIDRVGKDAAAVIRSLPNRAERDPRSCANHNPPHLYDCRA
jgi:hypothetical protein